MSWLVWYGICGLFAVLQIIIGLYWFYIIIRDNYNSRQRINIKIIPKIKMKMTKSASASVTPNATPNVRTKVSETGTDTPTSVYTKNIKKQSKKNSASLPYKSKLYTTISILGYTLYCIWVITYFGYMYFADDVYSMYVFIIMCILADYINVQNYIELAI